VSLEHLKDENVVLLYGSLQRQVEERRFPLKLVNSAAVKSYANSLWKELTRRHLQHSPIVWPQD
jgi:hypothetical protein